MKARFLRKLKTISTSSWNPGLFFQEDAPVQAFQASNPEKQHKNHGLPAPTGENISTSEASVDVEEEESASGPNAENLVLSIRSKEGSVRDPESKPGGILAVTMHDRVKLSVDFDTCLEIGSSACRSPAAETESISNSVPPPCLKLESAEDHRSEERVDDKEKLPLTSDSEDRCPPGGRDSVVLYATSLRGIRKTFEDCSTIRFLLESFRVVYSERDVSMHLEYREELWKILGGRVVPPRLFIRGRYVGGADEVVTLHERGMLQNLLQGIPLSPSRNPCRGCAGMRFVLCCSCNGSRKAVAEGQDNGASKRCPDCNENGLVKCFICS